jgi:cyclase
MNLKKKFIRIIPRLDVKNDFLIKGINLEGLRVLGEPYQFAKLYSETGADEIHYFDAVASLYGTNNLERLVNKTAKNLNIPLCVGGGIRSIKNIENILNSGADKISINTAFIENPKLVSLAAKKFGSSTISASIEYIRIGKRVFISKANGRDLIKIDPISWSKKLIDLGVGELIVTSVNHEGLMKGFDKDIVKEISSFSTVPVLIHGGAKNIENIFEIISETNIDGVVIASILHYETLKKFKVPKNKQIGNLEFLKEKIKDSFDKKISISEFKSYLNKKNINVRNDF